MIITTRRVAQGAKRRAAEGGASLGRLRETLFSMLRAHARSTHLCDSSGSIDAAEREMGRGGLHARVREGPQAAREPLRHVHHL